MASIIEPLVARAIHVEIHPIVWFIWYPIDLIVHGIDSRPVAMIVVMTVLATH